MKIRYHREKLQEIISDLHLLTGISLCVLDAEGNVLCKKVQEKDFCSFYQKDGAHRSACRASDQKLLALCRESGEYESHICPAGLYDAAFPIKKDSLTVGYILMGRVRLEGADFAAEDRYFSLYEALPVFDEKKLTSLRSLFANILFSSAMEPEKEDLTDGIKRYLEENLDTDITLSSLCTKFFVSKTKSDRSHVVL